MRRRSTARGGPRQLHSAAGVNRSTSSSASRLDAEDGASRHSRSGPRTRRGPRRRAAVAATKRVLPAIVGTVGARRRIPSHVAGVVNSARSAVGKKNVSPLFALLVSVDVERGELTAGTKSTQSDTQKIR
eukprot:SAG11_NODE_7314_length_1162_cov_1.760113_2_plen_130_part_00